MLKQIPFGDSSTGREGPAPGEGENGAASGLSCRRGSGVDLDPERPPRGAGGGGGGGGDGLPIAFFRPSPLLELAALLHSLGLRPAAGDQSGELWRSAAERARRGAEQAAGQRAARGAAARHARPRASGVRREARKNMMGEVGRR